MKPEEARKKLKESNTTTEIKKFVDQVSSKLYHSGIRSSTYTQKKAKNYFRGKSGNPNFWKALIEGYSGKIKQNLKQIHKKRSNL